MKKYLRNKEMSDPDWVHKKQQDWFALKAAWQRFCGSKCRASAFYHRNDVKAIKAKEQALAVDPTRP